MKLRYAMRMLREATETRTVAPLVLKLMAAQDAMGWADDEMATRCGVKLRMWQMVKAGDARLGFKSLPYIVRNFRGLREDVLDYLGEQAA